MAYWDPTLLSALAQHYQVVTVDLPGTGYSSPAKGPVSLQWWADETAGFIAALGLQKPVVLGWGLGGDVALDLAETHPGILGSLVLVDTPVHGGGAGPVPAAEAKALAAPDLPIAALANIWFGSTHAATRAAWLQAMITGPPDALTAAARQAQINVASEVARSSALVARLGRVTVPSFIVYGGSDPMVPVSDGEVLAGGLAHSRALALSGGDYGAVFEYAATFVSALEQFTG